MVKSTEETKCSNCGLTLTVNTEGLCGYCAERRRFPGRERIEQALMNLPHSWFGYKEAAASQPFYYSYTLKILTVLKTLNYLEVRTTARKEFRLKDKVINFIKNSLGDGEMSRKPNSFNGEEWKEKILGIVEANPGCYLKEIEVEGIGDKQIYAYLKTLEKEGLITPQTAPDDKRKKVYYATSMLAVHPPEEENAADEEGEVPTLSEEEIGVKVTDVTPTNEPSTPSMGQLLDMVWPHCTSANPRKPRTLKNQDFEALVVKFSDQKTLLNIFQGLPQSLQESTRITIDDKQEKIQLIIPTA